MHGRARGDAHFGLRRRARRAGAGTLLLPPRGAGRARHRLRHPLSAQPRMGLFPRADPRRRSDRQAAGGVGMGRFTFRLPDIGEGIAEAEIVAWHVKPGDLVKEDGRLADLMTDKATVEMESPVAGKVLEVAGEVGDVIAIGSTLVVLETEGEAGEAPAATPALATPVVEKQIEVETP